MRDIPGVVPYKPDERMTPERLDALARPRGGLFRGMGQAARRLAGNDGDPTTPNFLEWLMHGPAAPDVLQRRQQRGQLFPFGIRREKLEQARLERELSTPPEAPETWSEPFDMNGVPVQRSSRDNQYRAIGNQQPPLIFQPPAGYTGTPEELRPIRGGPADIRQTAEGRARIAQADSSIRQLENAVSVLGEALPQVDWDSTGMVGQVMRGVGGSDAYNLNQALEPVRAILSFESLQEMRRNSTTGGALGSIAVRELELLGNTVRSLDTAQSTPQMRRAIEATRAQLSRTLQALRAAKQEMEAGPDAAPMEPMASEGEQPRTRVWNRQTGRVE